MAAKNKRKDAAICLIEKGADIYAKDCNNSTVLHFSTAYGWIDVVKLLIKKGADIHAKDRYN